MKFEAFVAFRYLRAKRKQTMVSVISAISVLGIAAGVMALVIAMALSTGFKEDIQSKILRVTSAVNLLKLDGTPLLQYEELLQKTRHIPHVTGSAPAIFKPVYIASSEGNQIAAIKGIDPDLEGQVSDFFSYVISGDPQALRKQPAPSLGSDLRAPDSILIGKEMARTLRVRIGDTLKVPVRRLTPLGTTISEKTLRVAAIFPIGPMSTSTPHAGCFHFRRDPRWFFNLRLTTWKVQP
jgi:lipoprotein-releasing system permease protein